MREVGVRDDVAPAGVETDDQLGAWIARGSAVARSLPPK